jgi:hypothetical protein
MGALKIADLLRQYAAQVPTGKAIVEVGSWLGAGTYELAAASNTVLHVYDYFKARGSEITKAAAFGIELAPEEDTLPMVKAYLKPFGSRVVFHKGAIHRAKYNGPPIGLYVDDASKSLWKQVVRIFSPYFDQDTVLILMDYHYPKCTHLREAMNGYEMLLERTPDSSTAIFRWRH